MTGPIQQTTSLKIKIIKSKWKRQFLQMKFLIAQKILCEYFTIFSQNIAILSLKAHRVRTKSFFIIKTEESKFFLIIKVNLESIYKIALRLLSLLTQEVQFKTFKRIGFTTIIILTNLNKSTPTKTIFKKEKLITILQAWK